MSKLEGIDDYQKLEDEIKKLEHLEENEKDRWTARRAMIGAMLTNFCVGSYFLYGNYNPFIGYWIKQVDESIEPKNTLIVQPVWLMCQTVITTVGVKLADKFGFRNVIYCSIFAYVMVNLLTSYCQNYWAYVLVYGIGSGCSLGLGYLLSLYIAWTYYPDSKSIVTGLVLFATGSCPAILAPVTGLVVNPNGKKPFEKDAYENVPYMFRILALIYGVILVLIILVLPPPKKSLEMKRKNLMKKLGHEEEDFEGSYSKDGEFQEFFGDEKQNEKDLAAIEDIDVEDSPVTKGKAKLGLGQPQKRLDINKGDETKIQSLQENNLRAQTMQSHQKDARRLTGTYRNSIAFLQSQQVFSDIQNMVSSESMVLMQGMSSKYIDNLKSLHRENEENRRRTIGFQEGRASLDRKSVSNQKNLKLLRESIMRAKETNKNIAEILPRETIAKIVTENAEEMDPEVIEDIAGQLIESQCPDMWTGIKHPNFTILVIMCIGSTIYNFFMNAAFKEFITFTEIEVDPNEEDLILTIAAIFEAISGLIAGGLLIFIPFKYFYIAQITIQVVALLFITSAAKSYASVTAYISLSMYFLGSDKTVFPTITQKLFGPIAGPKIYPFVYVFFAVSSLAQFVIYNFITDDMKVIFTIFSVMGGISLIATFFLNMSPTWMKKKGKVLENKKRFLKEEKGEFGDTESHNVGGESLEPFDPRTENGTLGEGTTGGKRSKYPAENLDSIVEEREI